MYESVISGVLPAARSAQPTAACCALSRRVGQYRYASNDSVIRESRESCREARVGLVSRLFSRSRATDRGDAEAAEGDEMVRWGVIGPGAIAVGFADAMHLVDDGEIVAVASRSAERADAFGDRFGVPTRYDSYAALGEDPNVDVVYVATPQSRHAPDTVAMLQAGKHVLCEKPFALNAGYARADGRGSSVAGLFLMEAIWSRFLPSYRAMVDVLGTRANRRAAPGRGGFRVPPADRSGGSVSSGSIWGWWSARPGYLSDPALLAGAGPSPACCGGGGHRGDRCRRAGCGSAASSRRRTWSRQGRSAGRHDVYGPDLGHRGLDRRSRAHALSQCLHRDDRRRIRARRLFLRRQWAAV